MWVVIFTSGINRKIDFSHAAEANSGFLLNEFLVLQLEQSTLFPAFKMAAILSWWQAADTSFFYWSVDHQDNGSAEADLKVCCAKRYLFAHPLLFSSLQWLGEVAGCEMDAVVDSGEIFGRSETKGGSFLRQAWSGIGFIITWQLIFSYMIKQFIHLYWEINVPPLRDFIAIRRIIAWLSWFIFLHSTG